MTALAIKAAWIAAAILVAFGAGVSLITLAAGVLWVVSFLGKRTGTAAGRIVRALFPRKRP
jgi:hypothetical protein